jgi:pimeloyl-ACP methyl ester carboxylesterase
MHVLRIGAATSRLIRLFALSCTILPAFACAAESIGHTMRIEGRGAPTVIFEAGLGDTLETWRNVQSDIAKACTRTIAYDRAGYRASHAATGARDAEHIVAELRAELHGRGIRPPYVLVGHSLGGLYMQYFARQHPQEVAGLVLVDSTHWNQQLLLNAQPAAAYTGRQRVLLFMSWIARRELADSTQAGQQVHESPAPGDLPAVVLSSTQPARGETPASRTAAARLQEDIAADFPAARHVRVEASGHYIQNDRPDVVIDAVRELAGCAARAPH